MSGALLLPITLLANHAVNAAVESPATIFSGSALIEAGAQHDRGLSHALQAAVTENPAAKGKLAELAAEGHNIDSAKAGWYPSLSGQANTLSEDHHQGTLRLQQPLWSFGKIETGIRQAEAGFAAEQWGLLQVQRLLIEDTAATYARVEGIQQREELAKINIAEHERLYQRIKRRQQGQLASEADVQLAYSRLIQARAKQARIRGEWQVALTDLHTLTQVPVTADQAVEPHLAELPSQADVEALALQNSADVHYKREQVNLVRLDIEKEKAAAMPTLSFRVEHDIWDSQDNIDQTRVGIVIEGNFEGMGFVTHNRVKSAASRLMAAQHDLSVSVNDVRRRVSTLMLNRQVQEVLILSQQAAVEAVEATMASFLRQYDSGRKSWLEVLNTQRELTELRLQLAQIESDWLIVSLRVSALVGSLDTLAGIEP